MNSSQTTSRIGTVLATVGAVVALAASAQAATSTPAGMTQSEYRALMIRSEALNTLHGNAVTRLSPQQFTGLYQAGANRMAPQRELGLDPLLERGQPLLFQPRSLAAGEGVAELRQRRPTPQGQPFPVQPGGLGGLLRARRRYQRLEAMEVEFTIADPDEIAGGLRQDQIPAERLAQLGDVHLERRRGGVGR